MLPGLSLSAASLNRRASAASRSSKVCLCLMRRRSMARLLPSSTKAWYLKLVFRLRLSDRRQINRLIWWSGRRTNAVPIALSAALAGFGDYPSSEGETGHDRCDPDREPRHLAGWQKSIPQGQGRAWHREINAAIKVRWDDGHTGYFRPGERGNVQPEQPAE